MIQTLLLVIAAVFLLWEAWDRLIKPVLPQLEAKAEPVIAEARKAEAYAVSVFHTLQPELKKDATVISDTISAKLSQLGAAISASKTEAANQKTRADAAESALASANAHIAELTSQLATEQQNHADDIAAVSAAADQASAS